MTERIKSIFPVSSKPTENTLVPMKHFHPNFYFPLQRLFYLFLSQNQSTYILFISLWIIFTSLKAKRKIFFPCALTGHSSSAFLPQKLTQILLCSWAGCWPGTAWVKLHFLCFFTPKLIVNTPHQLLISPCLHFEPQERLGGIHKIHWHPRTFLGMQRCADKRLCMTWIILSGLEFTPAGGSAKNHRDSQAKLVFLWSLCAAILTDCLIFPKRGQLFPQISFITIYPS